MVTMATAQIVAKAILHTAIALITDILTYSIFEILKS